MFKNAQILEESFEMPGTTGVVLWNENITRNQTRTERVSLERVDQITMYIYSMKFQEILRWLSIKQLELSWGNNK